LKFHFNFKLYNRFWEHEAKEKSTILTIIEENPQIGFAQE